MSSGRIMAGTRRLAMVTAAAAATLSVPALAQGVPPLAAVEKIYAELAALPKAERSRRVEQGARQEGRLVLV